MGNNNGKNSNEGLKYRSRSRKEFMDYLVCFFTANGSEDIKILANQNLIRIQKYYGSEFFNTLLSLEFSDEQFFAFVGLSSRASNTPGLKPKRIIAECLGNHALTYCDTPIPEYFPGAFEDSKTKNKSNVIDFPFKKTDKAIDFLDRTISDNPWLSNIMLLPEDYARGFIASSAWWYSHPSGRPVRAPKHSNNIYLSSRGWVIDFGANTFLISIAVSRANTEIIKSIRSAINGNVFCLNDLEEKIKNHIRGAVTNFSGDEYEGYYPVEGNDMIFGTQSIDTDDGAEYILEKFGIYEFANSFEFN
jgi:hypothetical protein